MWKFKAKICFLQPKIPNCNFIICISKTWKKGYAERAHYSLGLFLVQYLCNRFNMTDVYLDTYAIEMQMEFNSKLLVLDKESAERDELMTRLSKLSNQELAQLLAKVM